LDDEANGIGHDDHGSGIDMPTAGEPFLDYLERIADSGVLTDGLIPNGNNILYLIVKVCP